MMYEFTEQQDQAIGQLVTEHWGCHFQTGFGESGNPRIWIEKSKFIRWSFSIAPDGTVIRAT